MEERNREAEMRLGFGSERQTALTLGALSALLTVLLTAPALLAVAFA